MPPLVRACSSRNAMPNNSSLPLSLSLALLLSLALGMAANLSLPISLSFSLFRSLSRPISLAQALSRSRCPLLPHHAHDARYRAQRREARRSRQTSTEKPDKTMAAKTAQKMMMTLATRPNGPRAKPASQRFLGSRNAGCGAAKPGRATRQKRIP